MTGVRGALRSTGVSLKRMEGTGLGVASGLEKAEKGTNGGGGGGGVWLREVELLRLVLRFSRGVEEGRRAEEAAEEAEEGGRGVEPMGFSGAAEALEHAEPGLVGAGFRFGLVSEPLVGDETPALARSSPAFSRSSAVGLLAPQGWLRTDVAVEQSGREESEDWVIVSLPPPPPPPLFFEPPERSSNPIEPCLETLGVTLHAWDCCPLVWEWTLVIDMETPFPPSAGLHTCENDGSSGMLILSD